MRRFFISIISLTFSLIAFADMSSRGKSSDLPGYGHGKYEFLIPLLILVALGGVFLFFWSKDFLTKHKDFGKEVKSTVSLLGIVAAGGFFVWLGATKGDDFIKSLRSKPQTQSQTHTVDVRNDLPEGFVPVEQYRTNQNSDPWASYPPVIKGTPEEMHKTCDFMVAAICNPHSISMIIMWC